MDWLALHALLLTAAAAPAASTAPGPPWWVVVLGSSVVSAIVSAFVSLATPHFAYKREEQKALSTSRKQILDGAFNVMFGKDDGELFYNAPAFKIIEPYISRNSMDIIDRHKRATRLVIPVIKDGRPLVRVLRQPDGPMPEDIYKEAVESVISDMHNIRRAWKLI